jgi:hypothetical protein
MVGGLAQALGVRVAAINRVVVDELYWKLLGIKEKDADGNRDRA